MFRNSDAELHLNWARRAEQQGDFLAARMGYLKCVEGLKMSGDVDDLQKANEEYASFVKRDPFFEKLLSMLLPIIQNNPGILQSEITKRAESREWPDLYSQNRPIAREDIYYVLYFADKFGRIIRTKKGRSYELKIA